MTPEALALIPLDQLLGEVFRRCGLTVVADMSASARRGHMSTPVSAVSAVDTSELEQRRARWRRQKQAQRSRRTADKSTADTPVVVNDSKTTTTTADMSASTADADMLPGLARPVGAAPTPTPAPPDDLTRRKLRTNTVKLLARHTLDDARAAGTTIHNEGGWLRTVAASIGEQRAAEIDAALETALARWPSPDAAHVVTVLAEMTAPPPPPKARRVEQPVDRAPLPPRHEVAAGLEQVRSALRRTA